MNSDIFTSFPINKTAAIVVGKSDEFVSKKVILTNDSDFPIQIRPIDSLTSKSQGFVDLTGVKFGRFIVIGLSKQFSQHWVVRCCCGRYTTRRAKSIKNTNNTKDCCEMCRQTNYFRSGSSTG